MEFLQSGLFTSLMVILEIIVAVAGVFLIGLLKKLNVKTQINLDESIMGQINKVITDIVISTNQKIVDAMKEKNPDGKLTDEEKERVFNTVKDMILQCLSQTQLDYIINTFADLDEGLSILIEAAVKYEKW